MVAVDACRPWLLVLATQPAGPAVSRFVPLCRLFLYVMQRDGPGIVAVNLTDGSFAPAVSLMAVPGGPDLGSSELNLLAGDGTFLYAGE